MVRHENKRTYRTKELKFKVPLEAVREQKQVSRIVAEYGVSATQMNTRKRQLLEQGLQVFSCRSDNKEPALIEEQQELYRKVGEQAVQIDWLKNSRCRPVNELRTLVDPTSGITITKQCELLGLARSTQNLKARTFPYLLGYLDIYYPNQVRCTDITYIRLLHGYTYLTAFMDLFSKRILSWRLSNTLDRFSSWKHSMQR